VRVRSSLPASTLKRAEREIAALDFLLNIPMQNESAVLAAAMQATAPIAGEAESKGRDMEEVELLDLPSATPMLEPGLDDT
jgi:hypothetical protein